MPLAQKNRSQILFCTLLLVALTAAAYSPAMKAGFIWDDDKYVTDNRLFTGSNNLTRIWFSQDHPSQYFPLVYTSFWIEQSLFGMKASVFHGNNILLHILNGLLLWVLLVRMRIPGAWFATALFLLHPVQVESVAWITERKNLLSLLFTLLMLLSWLRFAEKNSRGAYLCALFLHALALLSKTTACTNPAALVLLLWIKRIPVDRKRWVAIIPFVLMGLLMGLLSVWWEQEKQGLHPEAGDISGVERLLIAARALWFYLGKLALPVDLSFSYTRWSVDSSQLNQYAWLGAALLASGLLFFLREKIGRGTLAAFLFFAACLSPMIGFISLYTFFYSYVADHYQYVACIGPLTLVAALLARVHRKVHGGMRIASSLAVGLLLLVLAGLTFERTKVYQDPGTLWRDTIKKNPESWMAHNNLGTFLQDEGEISDALHQFREAIQIKPEHGQLYFNQGTALQLLGRNQEAIPSFKEAIRLEPDDPDSYNNLGLIFHFQGRYREAIQQFKKALELKPNYGAVHNNLGGSLRTLGRLGPARLHYKSCVEYAPEMAEGWYNLGSVLLAQGKPREAIPNLRQSIKINEKQPNAHYTLGLCLSEEQADEEAVPSFLRATELKTGWAQAHDQLAWILATSSVDSVRNAAEAERHALLAAELSQRKNAGILDTLAAAQAAAGKFEEAIKTQQEALDLARFATKETNKSFEAMERRLEMYRSGNEFQRR